MGELCDYILKLFGLAFILLIIGILLVVLRDWLKDTVDILRWEYKKKHRFDKPPKAQCYCKDCRYYETYNGYGKCTRGHIKTGWNIEDSWFCWQAVPLKRDPDSKVN